MLDHPLENKGTSCSRNVRRSGPCLHGLLSGQKEVSHKKGRKCKEGGDASWRSGLSLCTHLALVSLSSQSHRTPIPLSSHSHLTLVSLLSHSRLSLISLSSHSHLTLISRSSRSDLTLIALSSHFRRSSISLSSPSFHSHLTFITLASQHGLVWAMTQSKNTHIRTYIRDPSCN
jgi:hypothetical protein